MACFALVIILSLICLLPSREYNPNQQASSSTINKTLSSEHTEEELPSIGQVAAPFTTSFRV